MEDALKTKMASGTVTFLERYSGTDGDNGGGAIYFQSTSSYQGLGGRILFWLTTGEIMVNPCKDAIKALKAALADGQELEVHKSLKNGQHWGTITLGNGWAMFRSELYHNKADLLHAFEVLKEIMAGNYKINDLSK